jgi:excinuclease ABC subunit A
MDLLPDVTVGCEVCQGQRFQPRVLECLLEGRNIAEVLDSTVAAAARFLAQDRALAKPLQALEEVGLGYLRLGQEGQALSLGETQRLRLAGLLSATKGHPAAILLDEPTRGLGFEDVDRLVTVLRKLARAGHLVVVVEHALEFIAAADWVIDLGPEAGPGGGLIVAQGPPQALIACTASYTGRALAAHT